MNTFVWEFALLIGLAAFAAITRWLLTRAHLAALAKAEQRLAHVQLRTSQTYQGSGKGQLVSAEVVLAVDAFSTLKWTLRTLIGGESKTLQGLTQRARREAIVRLKREAQGCKSKLIIGARYEPARLNTTFGRNQLRIAIRVTGTAITQAAA